MKITYLMPWAGSRILTEVISVVLGSRSSISMRWDRLPTANKGLVSCPDITIFSSFWGKVITLLFPWKSQGVVRLPTIMYMRRLLFHDSGRGTRANLSIENLLIDHHIRDKKWCFRDKKVVRLHRRGISADIPIKIQLNNYRLPNIHKTDFSIVFTSSVPYSTKPLKQHCYIMRVIILLRFNVVWISL